MRITKQRAENVHVDVFDVSISFLGGVAFGSRRGGSGDERLCRDAQSSIDIEEFIRFSAEGADVGGRIEQR